MLKKFRHLFVPHPVNNHKPKLLHHSSLAMFIFLFIAAQIVLSCFMVVTPQVLGIATNISTKDLLDLTNQKRIESGVGALRLDPKLMQAAALKASDMFKNNYWAHIGPKGETPWSFIENANYEYKYAGENLARDFNYSNQVIDAWLKSESHRKNLLDSRYQDVGFAVVNGKFDGHETTLVVQIFGTKGESSELAVKQNNDTYVQKDSDSSVLSLNNLSSQIGPMSKVEAKPLIDVASLTRIMSIGVAVLLVVLLYIDVVHLTKNKVYRISGNSLAHMILLLIVIGMLYLVKSGSII